MTMTGTELCRLRIPAILFAAGVLVLSTLVTDYTWADVLALAVIVIGATLVMVLPMLLLGLWIQRMDESCKTRCEKPPEQATGAIDAVSVVLYPGSVLVED